MKRFLLILLFPLTAQADFICQSCIQVAVSPTAAPTAAPTRTPTRVPTVAPTSPPSSTIPMKSQYDANMNNFGQQNCNRLKNYSGFDTDGNPIGLNDTYYDAESVFAQIGKYRGESWASCMSAAHVIYSDRYVTKNNGSVPGYWLFPQGLADAKAKGAYDLMKANGAFVNSSAYNDNYQGGTQAWYAIRETAYALNVHLQAQDFGEPLNMTRINQLRDYLYKALDQTWSANTADYKKPFMTALAAEALINYGNRISFEPGIQSRIKTAADVMWNTMWLGDSFKYTDSPSEGTFGTPDLNLLIVPMYYWLYSKTGDVKYKTNGDTIWSKGVQAAVNLNNGKQFNQQYRWSMQGMKWRDMQPTQMKKKGKSK